MNLNNSPTFRESRSGECRLEDGEQIQIDLSFQMELADPAYMSIGIKPPPGVPDNLMDDFWVQGISNGVSAGILNSGYDLSSHDLEFAITDLKLSISFDEIEDKDIERIKACLIDLTIKLVSDMIKKSDLVS